MKPTLAAPCIAYEGAERNYQRSAADALDESGQFLTPWTWITAACGTKCLEPSHLLAASPLRISYPHGVCIYCGRHAATKDHLLPRPWTGDTQRRFVATVPACGTCNSILSDTLTVSITERRQLCHMRLRRKFAKVLRTKDHTQDEIDEYEGGLRDYIIDSIAKKAEVQRMLTWPDDPEYDERALQKSGIEDPYVIGLIRADDDPDMLAYLKAVA